MAVTKNVVFFENVVFFGFQKPPYYIHIRVAELAETDDDFLVENYKARIEFCEVSSIKHGWIGA